MVPSGLPRRPIDEEGLRRAAFADLEANPHTERPGALTRQTKPRELDDDLMAALEDSLAETREAQESRKTQEDAHTRVPLTDPVVLPPPRIGPPAPRDGRRRQWPDDEKAAILAEVNRDGMATVMSKYKLSRSAIVAWGREAREAAAGRMKWSQPEPVRIIPRTPKELPLVPDRELASPPAYDRPERVTSPERQGHGPADWSPVPVTATTAPALVGVLDPGVNPATTGIAAARTLLLSSRDSIRADIAERTAQLHQVDAAILALAELIDSTRGER